MRQTLFFIPHQLAGIDVFGFGWLLAIWLLVSVGYLVWLYRQQGDVSAVTSHLGFVAVVALAIAFGFPRLEARDVSGQLLGLPVRGYGTFVLAGFGLGVVWAMRRANRRGISSETISSLALWMFVAGFIGARLFFVIEYWDEDFRSGSWLVTLTRVVRITEGGLVVYGALLAVLPALVLFCIRHSVSPLLLGDVVAPSMVLGLALGRFGCLMNGCCYGGLCEHGPIGVQFPRYNSAVQRSVSPPYQHQWATGQLHGFTVGVAAGDPTPRVRSVIPDSAAARAGLLAGATIAAINGHPTPSLSAAMQILAVAGPEIMLRTSDGTVVSWSIGSLPPYSLPVHPVQIYSAINALLLCLVLVASEPYLNRTGALLALLLTLYPPLRIVEEMIRVDEPGQFGTELSISQLISVAMLVFAAGLWLYLWRGAARSSFSSA